MSQGATISETASSSSADRLVLFIGGFDPRGARHYHQLMQQQAAIQGPVTGTNYTVGSRGRWILGQTAGLKHSAWSVGSREADVATDYVFFDWSDAVRAHWPKHTWQVVARALKTYGAVWKVRACLPEVNRQAPYTLWTLAYPLFYMALCLLLSVLAGMGVFAALPNRYGAGFGVLAALGLLFLGYKLDKLLHVSWLLRILNFAPEVAEQPVNELQQRMEATAKLIAEQMASQRWRDVVVVGFSVGSAVSVSFMDALRQSLQNRPDLLEKIHLLTLGNCIPLFALMPKAVELRRQLRALAEDRHLYWTDISSPSDSVSFGMCDVVGLSLRGPEFGAPSGRVNPRHMCSPRFHKLFTPETYRRLRRNKMRMHFQYLMAGELAGAYDYFGLITSDGLLRDYIEKRLVR